MIGGDNPPPPKPNLDFRPKKGGGHPKLGKNSINSDLAETFRLAPGLRKKGIGNEKFYPPLAKTKFYAKEGGDTQNQAKIQPTLIWLKV